MFKQVMVITGFILLSGCSVNTTIAMKLQQPTKPDTTLVGNLLINGGYSKTIQFKVTDGYLQCNGVSETFKAVRDENTINISNIKCSDGRTGSISLTPSYGNPPRGLGTGRLDDGTKLKVLVGDLAGTIDW